MEVRLPKDFYIKDFNFLDNWYYYHGMSQVIYVSPKQYKQYGALFPEDTHLGASKMPPIGTFNGAKLIVKK